MKRNKIWLANKPLPGSIRKIPYKPGYITIDCSVGQLSPTNIGPVCDLNGNICANLHNFMEYIKVSIYHDDDGPTPDWDRWRLRGFKRNEIYNHNSYLYSYNGRKLDWLEERQLFKEKIKQHINIEALCKKFELHNLLLIDYNIPNCGEGFLFTEDKLINYRNYKYSHANVIAEMLHFSHGEK